MRSFLFLVLATACTGGGDPDADTTDSSIIEAPDAEVSACTHSRKGNMACTTRLCCLNGSPVSIENCQVGTVFPPCDSCSAPFTTCR